MARILVQDDDGQTVLDERALKPEHFSDEHSTAQLIERVEWAVSDGTVKRDRPRRIPPESALTRTFD